MQRVSRLKYLILATIACVILFCVAAFSVSLALWSGSDETTAEVSGESGLFYVEYPRDKKVTVTAPDLADDIYYLQVQKAGGVSDYYEMEDNPKTSGEKMLTNVYLTADTVIDIYKGTTQDSIRNKKDGSAAEFEHVGSNTAATGKVTATGYYNFYYEYDYSAMYVDYKSFIGLCNITFNFDEGDSVKFYFKTADNAVAGCNNIETAYMHTWPGAVVGNIKDHNNGEVNFADKSSTKFKFGFGNSNNWWNYQSQEHSFSEFTVSEYLITLNADKEGEIEKDEYSDSGNTVTIATPAITGPTVFGNASETTERMGEQIVREVNAKITKNDSGQFVYNNYICVSRKNEDGAADNSIAYLEFSVSDCKINGTTASPYNVVVKSVTLTRRDTDENGVPADGYITPAPRIYNYDSNEMRLGPDPSHTKPDPDGSEGRYAIFAHGNKHDVSEGLEGEAQDNHMQDHYDDGTYVVLFFGDGYQQYFALDIEIVLEVADATAEDLDFTLTVHASNTNNWQRYEEGYGKPWGLYLGGLINDVWSWDPSRTTEMSGNPAITADDVSTINQNGIMVSYPKPNIAIDYTITLNLTQGSLVKPYLLDSTGYRRQEGGVEANAATAYFVAKKIIASDGLYDGTVDGRPYYNINSAVNDLGNINIYIPYTGEYTFRLKGKVTPGYTAARSGWYVNLVTGETKKVDDNEEAPSQDDYWYGVAAFNFLVDELYISTADTAAEFTVKFELNGGTGAGDYSDQTVKFGQCATKPADPTKESLNFGGWYTNEACTGTAYDFNTIVTDNITLYAKWAANMFTVTFDAKGGSFDEGVQNEVTVAEGTTVSKIQPDPKYAKHIFDGWYDNEGCTGEPYDFDTAVTGAFTLYAKWLDAVTVTFDLGDGTTQKVEIVKGSTVTEWPEIASTGYHHFDGWFTDAADGTQIDTDTATFDADTTVYARFTDKVRIIIDASVLYNVNNSNTYHIYAWDDSDTAMTGAWTERDSMTPLSGGKFYYDLDQVPSGFIVTLDSNDTRIELGRYAHDSVDELGLALGTATTLTMNVASLTFDSQLYNQIGLVFNDGVVVFNAAYDIGWNTNVRPTNIKLNDASFIIEYNKFTKYNYNIGAVSTIDLNVNGNSWTGVIKPGEENFAALENGKIYNIRYQELTEKIAVTVTFDSDDGSDVAVQSVWKGNKVTKPADPSRAGYIFNGWYNGSAEWDFDEEVSVDITLTAQWLEAVTVTFNGNEGTWSDGKGEQTVTLGKGQKVTAYAAPDNAPDNNVIFTHWSESQDGGPFNFNTAITGDKTLYAVWKNSSEVTKYTVTFHTNGGTAVSAQEVVEGHNATMPTSTKTNWTFAGWYADEACSWYAEFDFSNTPIVDNIDLYARWIPDEVQANSYYLVGHDKWSIISKYYIGSTSGFIKITFPADDMSGTYFRLIPTKNDKSIDWDNNNYGYTDIGVGLNLCNRPNVNENNIAIRAAGTYVICFNTEWNKKIAIYDLNSLTRVNVTFKLDSDTTYQTHSVVSGCPVTPWPSEPEREGLRFDGWYIGDTQVSADTVFSADATVTAKWVKTMFDITFDYNGNVDGSTPTSKLITDTNGKLTESLPTPTRAGYAFGGWYTVKANSPAESTKVTADTVFTGDITVYAKWQYTVTYYAGTGASWGDGSTPHSQQVDIGGKATALAAPENKPSGTSFAGWYTSADGDTEWDFNTLITADYTVNGNLDLYAHWSANITTYEITFDAGDGTLSGASTVSTNGNKTLAGVGKPTASLANCTFAGWFTEDGTEITDTYVFSGPTTVYAHWNVTVTFNLNYTGATGAPDSQTFARGSTLAELPTPATRLGYTFHYWRTGASSGTEITTSTTFDVNTTIYAYWTEKYVMVVGSNVYDLELNTENTQKTEYMITDKSLAKDAIVTFKYGDTALKISIGDYSANVLANGTTAVKLSDSGYYSLYISKEKTASTTTTTWELYSEYSAHDAGGTHDLYIRGTWGTGGGGSWTNRKVASNLKAGDTITFTFKILKSSQFGFMLANKGSETQTAWGGYSSSAKQITQIYDYGGSNWWTGDYEGRYTFTITVNSGTSITVNSISAYVAG